MDIFKTLLLDTPNSATVSGTIPVSQGGTGATNASDARTNLGAAASGANSDITSITGLTGGISTPDFVQFDTAATPTPAAGMLYWNNDDGAGTLSVMLKGGVVTQNIGESMFYRVKASAAITAGQVIMFDGVVGSSGQIKGKPATGLTPSQGNYIIGVAAEGAALNDWCVVQEFGFVRNINTTGGAETWAAGDILYYNPAVTGGLTKVVPTAPNPRVEVAAVVVVSSTVGEILVRVSHGSSLGETDSNVQFGTLANNDFIVYDGTDQRWENRTAADVKTALSLNNVENTALSTWAGSTNITTLGTISTGTVPVANISGLATVATSGKYSDLSGTPSLATVATTGKYSDLSGTPTLATVATTGAYADLSGTPTLATVATSGKYSDLSGLPTLGTISSQAASNVAITGGAIDGTTLGATTAASGKFTTLDATGNVGFDGGTFTFNEAGADKDFRIEGDSKTHLFFSDASVDRIGINQSAPASTLDLDGNYASNITAVSALDIDCSTANYFTKTIAADSTFTFSNPPSSRAYAFAIEVTHTSGAITWPATVKWPKDTAPTLTTGKTHIFIFVTDDGGTRWRGASLVDYVN
jgi:hypothetical protein